MPVGRIQPIQYENSTNKKRQTDKPTRMASAQAMRLSRPLASVERLRNMNRPPPARAATMARSANTIKVFMGSHYSIVRVWA